MEVCFLPFNSSVAIVSHHYVLHIERIQEAVDDIFTAFLWKFKGLFHGGIVKSFYGLKLRGMQIHEMCILA